MLVAVACYVGLPLTIYNGVQSTGPLLFTAVSYLLGCGLYAVAALAPRIGEPGVKTSQMVSAVEPRHLLSMTVLKCDWVVFAAAIALAPAAVVTIVFEMWPVLFAVLCLTGWWRRRMHGGERLDRSVAATTLAFMTIGIAGVALAVMSDAGSGSWSRTAAAGTAMAAFAAAMTASEAAAAQMMGKHQRGERAVSATQVSAVGDALSKALLGGLMLAAVGVWRLVGGNLEASWSGLRWAAVAAVLQTGGKWLFMHANHLAREREGQSAPQINSLYYLVPVGAVILLAWLADSTVVRPDLLICGLAGVVAVNMVMHLDPEGAAQRTYPVGRHGRKALVLAVWVCGTAVVLRDDWLPGPWQVWSVAEYCGMAGVLATVLVLMRSCRQAQMAELCCEEGRALHDVAAGQSWPLR